MTLFPDLAYYFTQLKPFVLLGLQVGLAPFRRNFSKQVENAFGQYHIHQGARKHCIGILSIPR